MTANQLRYSYPSGSATTTVREIYNTNLRRVLNFVYRELNQVYETEVVLTDIKVAFYNGNVSSLETASLGELRKFVAKFIVPDHQEEVARAILGLCAERLDDTGTPVSTLKSAAP